MVEHRKKGIIIALIAIGVVLSLILFNSSLNYDLQYKEMASIDSNVVVIHDSDGDGDGDDSTPNYIYTFNNNVAQYSSYIILDSDEPDGVFTIEAFLSLNFKAVKNFSLPRTFKCLLKMIDIENFKVAEETIELMDYESARLVTPNNRKLFFKFKNEDFSSYWENEMNFKLENLRIAVIRDLDYAANMTIDDLRNVTNSSIVLPYSLIKFQRPTIMHQRNPIGQSVGVCVHYLYSMPNQLIPWIDMHFEFNVAEILIYDATPNFTLSSQLEEKYGNNDGRINIRKYHMEREDLCAYSPDSEQILTQLCHDFYENEFKNKFHYRERHEQLTSNDCYSVLSRSHEYVTYYDIDEFVFPRQYDSHEDFFQSEFKCNSKTDICSMRPFKNDKGENKTNYFHNYLRGTLFNGYSEGRDVNKFFSFSFHHAVYMIPDYLEDKLIAELGEVIRRINSEPLELNATSNSSSLFPIRVFLGPSDNKTHFNLIINEEDVDYLRNFYKSYQNLIPCIYRDYLKKIPNLDESLIRYLCLRTHPNQRFPKAIHNYKNVKGLFIHYANHAKPNTWHIRPPVSGGHVLVHFRSEMHGFYYGNYTASIRGLFIDFEYIFYLLQHYTNYCKTE